MFYKEAFYPFLKATMVKIDFESVDLTKYGRKGCKQYLLLATGDEFEKWVLILEEFWSF